MRFHEWLTSFSKLWIPPERLSLSEWSERNLVLSSEYSSRSGLIRLHQYQKAIFDAFTDAHVNEITLMCSTQMVKSLFLQAIIAYIIVNDPASYRSDVA
jgi:phage terminase large subunit GpA-like protein